MTRPISNWTWFDNFTLRYSGEASVAGYGSGWSLGSIPGRVLICLREVVLPTTCAFLPTAARLSVLTIRSFSAGYAQRSCQQEGGKTPPSCLGIFYSEILDSLHRGGKVCPRFHHHSCQRLPLPRPQNGPLEKVDDDGRGDMGL